MTEICWLFSCYFRVGLRILEFPKRFINGYVIHACYNSNSNPNKQTTKITHIPNAAFGNFQKENNTPSEN